MKIGIASIALSLVSCLAAVARAGDRIYTADQTSNTVSVIDPAINRCIGCIHLGQPVPAALGALYKGELLVHGLGFSPDHKTLDVISIGSNSVTLIDTESNNIKGKLYIGRAPHEGFYKPDGSELWVAVRGENYISVIDPLKIKEVRRIETANGPAMVLFRPDGKYAFIPSSFTPEMDVIDTATYQVVARVPQASPFSPNLAVDQDEVWFTLKDSGKTQVVSAKPPFQTLATLETGPITNHVTFIENAEGKFAYVTVGGKNEVQVYARIAGASPKLVATIATGDLPHGIWGSGDGRRVYVGLENGDAVQSIDTASNQITAAIPVGQAPQALVYISDATTNNNGSSNLSRPPGPDSALHIEMGAPVGSKTNAHATVAVNSLGILDSLSIAATGLEPGKRYCVMLTGDGKPQPLIGLTAGIGGTALAQALGPLKRIAPNFSAVQPLKLEVRAGENGDGDLILRQLGP